jgi:hypothetical protein
MGKSQVTYKGRSVKITADFLTETLKERRAWNNIFQALKENNCCQLRLLYPTKLSLITEEKINLSVI